MIKLTWSTEKRKVSDLVPFSSNPRRMTEKQARDLEKSLKKFDLVEIPAIDLDGRIIAGHQRLAILQKLGRGEEEIDCRVPSRKLTEAEFREYNIRSNKNTGEWDFDILANEFELPDLLGWGFEEADFGVDMSDNGLDDVEPQIDKAEELRKKWDVKAGQLWKLGEHRLICGDCTEKAVVERVMGGETADAVLTDPPYGQNQKGVPGDDPENLLPLVSGMIKALPLKDGAAVFFQSTRNFPMLLDIAIKSGMKFERMLWLYKAAQYTFPWRGWILKSESILVFSKGKPKWEEVKPYSHDCYYLSEVSGELGKDSGWHGSVKPLSVVVDICGRIAPQGDLVYDPFLGSGTTLIACENTGRKCRAIEIDPGYCAVAIQRWVDATGRDPKLAE